MLVNAADQAVCCGRAPFLAPAEFCLVMCCRLQFTGKHTFFGKTATMLQAADAIGHLAQILLRIMIVLVTISVLLCVAILIFLIVYGKEAFATALEFVVVVLVASVPIAIEVVCTATLALGSRQLSAHGAIVTRLASIEEMAGMNMVRVHIV
jgi:H+-transporting ATPase